MNAPQEKPPQLAKKILTSIQSWVKDRRLPKEIRPGVAHIRQVEVGKRGRNPQVVAAADELAQMISVMADGSQYPVLTRWLAGKATSEEIEQANQIISGLRARTAKKYGVRIQDLEQERDDQIKDFL